MQKYLIIILSLMAGLLFAGDIIPVNSWPKTITTADKVICNPTIDQCVAVGYRLQPDKPATPEGKYIKSQSLVQDDKDPAKAKWVIVYEDIPPPETLTNVVVEVKDFGRVQFSFNTNSVFRMIEWLDAPGIVTNK